MIAGLLLALVASASAVPVPVSRLVVAPERMGPVLARETPLHLAVVLKLGAPDELAALLRAQQDPRSELFRRWITPEEFGSRFGQPRESYDSLAHWLRGQGFAVETWPNRLFLGATGTAASVRALLGVTARSVRRADGSLARTFEGTPTAPSDLAARISFIDGLDNQVLPRRRIKDALGKNTMTPQDARNFYDIAPLLAQGCTGKGAQLVVLAMASGSSTVARPEAVNFYLQNFSDSSAQYRIDVLPNPAGDFILSGMGALEEAELDPEMQSVAAPGAATITSVVAPASEAFTTGINYIVNALSTATAVSISYGGCETSISHYFGSTAGVRPLLQQGLAEGQSWFAATGDNGADDCGDGAAATVDFPASIPEIIAVGGTMASPIFDSNNAVTAYSQERVWNEKTAAGGGGVSSLYAKPAYQEGTTPADSFRDVPDISMMGGNPGVVFAVFKSELMMGNGTSTSAPLAAGVAALLSERLGCRLGDLHPALYALGSAQQQGSGVAAFHDIVSGNISLNGVIGASAAPGYDLASGWGSLDVAALAAALPACPSSPDGGVPASDGGALTPYDPCAVLGCQGNSCVTEPEGPSSCVTPCGSGCAAGTTCATLPVKESGCVPGCSADSDCAAGEHCYVCGGSCFKSKAGVHIGDWCQSDSDCAPNQYCAVLGTSFGFCSQNCYGMNSNCVISYSDPCPKGSSCLAQTEFCVVECPSGAGCGVGFHCIDPGTGSPLCLPGCGTTSDCAWAHGTRCVQGSMGLGSCLFPDGGIVLPPGADAGAGEDAAQPPPDAAGEGLDAGVDAAGPILPADAATGAGEDAGGSSPTAVDGGDQSRSGSGCGCASSTGSGPAWLALGGLLCILGRRRRTPPSALDQSRRLLVDA